MGAMAKFSKHESLSAVEKDKQVGNKAMFGTDFSLLFRQISFKRQDTVGEVTVILWLTSFSTHYCYISYFDYS